MKRNVYNQIVSVIDQNPWDFDSCLSILKRQFPDIQVETLRSILAQEHKKKVKQTYSYQTSKDKVKEVYDRFCKRLSDKNYSPGEGSIVDIARRNRFSPALTAKLIVEADLARSSGSDIPPTKSQISPLIRDTNLIEDGTLAYEVLLASLKDNVYGNVSECIRQSVGQAYERKLKQHLKDLGLPFSDEHQRFAKATQGGDVGQLDEIKLGRISLRARGYDKTPDVKLEVPIAVGETIINWIESKALFGDDESHASYLRDQLWSYWNRFGPGLVIYWFGFIDDLDRQDTRYQGILVADSFPQNITKLNLCFSIENFTLTESEEEE